ncbi:HotDog domain-containing protein [Geopyxis carbonaria]|nr:HotDog domain-containing protein [Geopyxis carbonaria]
MLEKIFIFRALGRGSGLRTGIKIPSSGVPSLIPRSIKPSISSGFPLLFSTSPTTATSSERLTSSSFTTPSRLQQRLYSSSTSSATSAGFSAAVEQALYFRPTTWFLSAIFFTLTGAGYLIMSARDFIAYSDEESLRNFQPQDPKQVEVEEYINSHPLTQSLRSKPEFTESRPTLKVNEPYRNASLTSGALAGPGRIVVPPYCWTEAEGRSLVSILYLGTDLCGYPGLVHGGLLATLLDEGLARCSFGALPNKLGMTANLTINYRKPSPAETFVVLRAKTVKVEGRKAWVEGHIETLPKDGEEPVILVEASALMVEPKQAQFLKAAVAVP